MKFDLSTIVVNGIPLIVIIFGLVEFCKKLGVSGNLLTVVSMILGVILGVCYQLSQMYPEFGVWFGVVIFGLACGLAAAGIYDFLNGRFPKAS